MNQKRVAAEAALKLVRPGMKLGLGSGSTASEFVGLLGAAVRDGLDVAGVPTSGRTEAQAREAGIELRTLDELAPLDLTIDGADEIDPDLTLIKGGGGALLREKIVAQASKRMIVVADASKQVDRLGAYALPVEIVRFGAGETVRQVDRAIRELEMAADLTLRRDALGDLFETDEGHLIVDCACGPMDHPAVLALALTSIAGVVEHGLFVGLAHGALIAGPDGVETLGQID